VIEIWASAAPARVRLRLPFSPRTVGRTRNSYTFPEMRKGTETALVHTALVGGRAGRPEGKTQRAHRPEIGPGLSL
jgi:hypothetical protein